MTKSEWITKSEDGIKWQSIFGKHCEITLEARQTYCDRGNWIAKVFTSSLDCYIDEQDGWPRYYFDEQRAKLELEAWLKKRNQWI
jgi:hypothetical protein